MTGRDDLAALADLASDAWSAGSSGEPLQPLLDGGDLMLTDADLANVRAAWEDGARERCPLPFCTASGLPETGTDEHGDQWYRCTAGHEFFVGRGPR